MDQFICYGVIDRDTNEFVRCSYKYPIPFYRRRDEAKNALKGYKAHRSSYMPHSKRGYQIVEICIKDTNIAELEVIKDD